MGGGQEFTDKLEDLKDLSERIGDDVGDRIEGETAEGALVEGFSCRHGAHDYLVVGTPEWEYFVIRYPVNIDEAVAIRHSSLEVERGGVNLPDNAIQEAREKLEQELNGQPPSQRRELRLNLLEIACREGCSINLDATHPLNIHGFQIDRSIFPYEESFGIQHYEYCVQTVINNGWVAKDLTLETYGLLKGSGSGSLPKDA